MDLSHFERLSQPGIRVLQAYDPGHDLVGMRRRYGEGASARHLPAPGGKSQRALVELGSNENPYGPSPSASAAVLQFIDGLHRYPDPLGGDLKRVLAAKHGVDPAQILLGNGSHELLMQFAQVFAGPGDDVVASQYGFAVYALAAQAVGATLRQARAFCPTHVMPRGHDLEAMAAALTTRTRLVYLANPNNPTGTWFGGDALAAFMSHVPNDVLVVVDEAYFDFVDDADYGSALALLDRHCNLIVTRTFSKAYALAGLRVGYAVAHREMMAVMDRVRESFNVNAVGLAAAEAVLGDGDHLRWSLDCNAVERVELAVALRQRGFFVHPSQTNFLLVELGEQTSRIERALLSQGVVVRPMHGYDLPHCLRITIGTAAENRCLLEALEKTSASP